MSSRSMNTMKDTDEGAPRCLAGSVHVRTARDSLVSLPTVHGLMVAVFCRQKAAWSLTSLLGLDKCCAPASVAVFAQQLEVRAHLPFEKPLIPVATH